MREVKTMCGEYMRVNLFPVRRSPKGKRGKRNKPTAEAMERYNRECAINRYNELACLNFNPTDWIVHLTFDDAYLPEDIEALDRKVKNYIRRVKRARKKAGIPGEFKYMYSHAAGEENGRLHVHMIITGGLDYESMIRLWGLGRIDVEHPMFDERGLIGFASYIGMQRLTYRRWHGSKNLAQPAVKSNDYKVTSRATKHIFEHRNDYKFIEEMYPGWSVGAVKAAGGGVGEGIFISLYLYRTENEYFRRLPRGIDYSYKKRGTTRRGERKVV